MHAVERPIRVTSYNVLADSYATQRLYPTVPSEILRWQNRGPLIAARLDALAPDVACLQEIEAAHWTGLRESLVPLGWEGIFAQKGKSRVDGCALLYRVGVAALTQSRTLHFSDGADPSGHLALIGVFDTALGTVRIASTHLRWQADTSDPGAHIGYRQAAELLQGMSALGEAAPTVICGDFNVSPRHPLVRLFVDHGFFDAYAAAPQPTCAPHGRAARIDYIFVSQDLEAVSEPLPMFEDAMLMPNREQPSDHVPITARLSRR